MQRNNPGVLIAKKIIHRVSVFFYFFQNVRTAYSASSWKAY